MTCEDKLKAIRNIMDKWYDCVFSDEEAYRLIDDYLEK